jgi:hypothetical protein
MATKQQDTDAVTDVDAVQQQLNEEALKQDFLASEEARIEEELMWLQGRDDIDRLSGAMSL